jgi:hypothetical protein
LNIRLDHWLLLNIRLDHWLLNNHWLLLNIRLDHWLLLNNHWLLLDIRLDHWLLNILDCRLYNGLDLLSYFRLVNNLSGDCLVVDSLVNSFNGDILNGGFIGGLWDVFCDVLNLVVVGNFGLNWDVFGLSNFLVFDDNFLVWDLFVGAVTSN